MINLDAVQKDIEGSGGKLLRSQPIEFHDGEERYFQVLDGDQVISFTVRANGEAVLSSAFALTPIAWKIIDVIRRHVEKT